MKHREMFGDAVWVEASNTDVCPVIRRSFDVSGIISAQITILGFGSFVFYINGKRGTEDLFLPLASEFEPRDFPEGEVLAHRAYPCRYDITEFLREGNNTLAVLLGNGWYNGARSFRHFDKPYGNKKLCYMIRIRTKDGEFSVASGKADKWHDSFVKQSSLTTGELHDYTDWDDRCLLPEFDDSTWQSVEYAAPVETEFEQSECPPDRMIRVISSKVISRDSTCTIYDTGKNSSYLPILRIAHGDQTVTFTCSEELLPNGQLDPQHMHRQTFECRLTEGREVMPMFTWLAFRYFRIEGNVEAIEIREVYNNVSVTSHFECDNDVLNWIYQTYLNTQLSNLHFGIPSDCPHLERRGYTGDGQLTCHAAMHTLDMQAFYSKWIRDISDCQDRKSGHVQYTAPYTHSGGGPGGWGAAIVILPYEYWRFYGDISFARQMFPQMLRYFDYMETHSENGLVIRDRKGEWCLGEWCTPGAVVLPAPFVNTYFYIVAMQKAIELANQLENKDEIPLLKSRIEARKRAIMNAYFNPWDGNFFGNLQGANAFALDIGLGNEKTKENFIAYYEELGHYDTGIFGTELVTRLLFEYGRGDVAYRLLTAESPWGFGKWRLDGATTFWEYWYQSRSHNHPMFGAVVVTFFEYILGVRQTENSYGYEEIRIQPCVMKGLKCANGSFETVKGKICVSYEIHRQTFHLKLSIPSGVRATVVMPDGSTQLVTQKSKISLFSAI